MPIEMSDSAPEFKFALGAEVVIAVSGEHGTVEGRAQYLNSEDNYFITYMDAQGRAQRDWWPESTLIT